MNKILQDMNNQTSIIELMQYIRLHGFPVDDLEAKNKISDIIGNKTQDELADYMNNVGSQQLLQLLSKIWLISDLFYFYNQYSKNSMVAIYREDLEDCNRDLKDKSNQIKDLKAEVKELRQAIDNHNRRVRPLVDKAESMIISI